MVTKLYIKALAAKFALTQRLKNEKGEVNIVAIVILIGIAVLLAFFFKDKIKDLLNNLFNGINQTATNVIQNKSP